MNTKKKLFNDVKDYAMKVMKCQDFIDYMKVVEENYFSSHKKARTETLSFANESNTLREAYVVLNATISAMEGTLAECFNEFNGATTNETFNSFTTMLSDYLSLPNLFLFIFQNLNDFGNNASTPDGDCPLKNEYYYATGKEFFNSLTYEYVMYLLKKVAYEAARKVYDYIENHATDSVEITNWKNECKRYITNWDNKLTKSDKWFNTDDLSDTDVLLGSVKIFMTAKMMSLLEE